MRRKVTVKDRYLRLPVRNKEELKTLCIYVDGEKQFQFEGGFYTGKDPEAFDFFGELLLEGLKGKEIEIELEGEEDIPLLAWGRELLPAVKPEEHPYLHFTPNSGWMNDPNGLCVYQGEYHLFFQHNLFGTVWNNISWGHAVSRDLLHWEQVEEALLPDEKGAMFSGSAIEENGELLLYYTHAGGRTAWSEGEHFTQDVARSRDGRHFQKDAAPVLPWIVYENRDPKVYRYRDGSWFMVLFLEEHDYAIFRSGNGRDWEMTQKLTIPESWECPDLVELRVDQGKETRWVFWTADSYYLVGDFDGRQFTPVQPVKKLYENVHKDRCGYAAQSFWGIPGRTIQLAWMLHYHRENPDYVGGMSVPRELELHCEGGEYVLQAHPVRELAEQKQEIWSGMVFEQDGCVKKEWTGDGAAVLRAWPESGASFSITLCGQTVSWKKETELLLIGGIEPIKTDGISDLTLLADKGVLEVGWNQDTACCFAELSMTPEKSLCLSGRLTASLGIVR